jgi:hypothetical protein
MSLAEVSIHALGSELTLGRDGGLWNAALSPIVVRAHGCIPCNRMYAGRTSTRKNSFSSGSPVHALGFELILGGDDGAWIVALNDGNMEPPGYLSTTLTPHCPCRKSSCKLAARRNRQILAEKGFPIRPESEVTTCTDQTRPDQTYILIFI